MDGNYDFTQKKKKPTSFWLAIIFGILLLISGIVNLILFVTVAILSISGGIGLQDKIREMPIYKSKLPNLPKIVVVPIRGIIESPENSSSIFGNVRNKVEFVRQALEKVEKNTDIKAIILYIDSPGGGATASDTIYKYISDFKEKHKDIKIISYIAELGASGGYYVAMASDYIIANPSAITGSIGVVIQGVNIKGLLDKVGIETETIKSGEKKDILSPFRSLTEDEKKILQEIVDEFHNKFLEVVKKNRRNLTMERIKALADGSIFSGLKAKSLGLVDEVGFFEDAVEIAKKMAKISSAQVVEYTTPPLSIFDLLQIRLNGNSIENLADYYDRFSYIKPMYIVPYYYLMNKSSNIGGRQ